MTHLQVDEENKVTKKNIAVVIPAFNEVSTIEYLVHEINHRAIAIVVDDGSTDGTADLARDAGAIVINHKINRGYDAALETGLRTACSMGYPFVVTMDADGQHDPILLTRFSEAFEAGADLVIGQRDIKQRWAESLFCVVGRMLWGISDPLCGMKGYRTSKFMHIDNINTYNSIGTELAILMRKSGANISQLLIKTNMRNGASRFGMGLIPNLRICKALWYGIISKR